MSTGTMSGADPELLDGLGQQMSGAAQQLRAIQARLTAHVRSAPWLGRHADAFRADWASRHVPATIAMATALETAASVVSRNAADQRQASSASDSSSALAATTTALKPGDAPGVPGGQEFVIGPPTKPNLVYDDDFPYDPQVQAGIGDYASLAEWKAKLAAGSALRPDLDDATTLYAHYLDGSGTPMTVDYAEAYAEDPTIRAAVDTELARAQQAAERIAASGQSSFSITGDPSSVQSLGGYPSTENWQKTLGDHQLWTSGDVTVNGDTATMTVTVNAEDRYNFNAGATDIATGAADAENGRFSTLGWAKGFDTHGEIIRTVTWTIGDPSSVVASGAPAPGYSPGGEDRVDGLGDGR